MCAAKRLSVDQRKKEIMDSASKVILQKGFSHTTMEDIIAGTTLSKGGVYHYYSSVVEIFKDIMILGLEYRIDVIKQHLSAYKNESKEAFMAERLVEKILDENPYISLYVEFLIAKRRNSELDSLMTELQEQTKKAFQTAMHDAPKWLMNQDIFQFLTDFINAMMMASNVLNSRECFDKNRKILKQMMILILEDKEKEFEDEGTKFKGQNSD